MILSDLLRALAQIGDPAFRRTLLRGLALTLGLLVAAAAAAALLAQWLLPDAVTLPWIGTLTWLDDAASGASALVLLAASVFLMVPVASLFTGLFLDDVADAVEARHYPEAGPAARLSWGASARETGSHLAVMLAANAAALIVYLGVPPLAPLVFWALNGFLLGREYFHLAALRRMPRAEALALRRRHGAQVWALGTLMAVPLTVPLLGLVVPVLGAAAFTHLVHRVRRRDRARGPRRSA